jgi:hypothetical protein
MVVSLTTPHPKTVVSLTTPPQLSSSLSLKNLVRIKGNHAITIILNTRVTKVIIESPIAKLDSYEGPEIDGKKAEESLGKENKEGRTE